MIKMTKRLKPKRRCLTIEFAKANGEAWIKRPLKRLGKTDLNKYLNKT